MIELESIEGIGSKTKELLGKLNILTGEDLLAYYPYRYDVIKRSDIQSLSNGDHVVIDGYVVGQPTIIYVSKSIKKMIFRISTKANILNITIYNRIFLYQDLKTGKEVTIIGKYDKLKNTIVASEVRMGLLPPTAKIEPIYHTTAGLSSRQIGKLIGSLLKEDFSFVSKLPKYIEEKYRFPMAKDAIYNVHLPSDGLSLKKARQRIKYEELFMYMLKINYLKVKNTSDEEAISRDISKEKLDKFIGGLPFALTVDQKAAINEIVQDLASSKRMNRLLQGDVGSGKTIVAFTSVYANYLAGYQSALMAPTEILAMQHYEAAKKLFEDYGVNVALLTSSTGKRKREEIYDGLERGRIDLVIGTQSLIQEKVNYHNLGFVITDEQHRFGVNQRSLFRGKGKNPDVLSMSATPIPRTYALTIYGDTDVSSIHTKPSGRKEVKTYFKKEKDITEVLEMMKGELDNGHQIYVVAPMIEEDASNEVENVNDLEEKMNKAFGKIYTIGKIHGKLEPEEKSKIMTDFEENKINILISTTVIEVGVNVPNASMIVIFNANMFGLSTLHQLRGRVGRSDIQSYCILIAKEAEERLHFLEKTTDGFAISEYDFENRGEGDLFGVRQSGALGLNMASVSKDFKMLLRAKEDATLFMDMYLADSDNPEYSVISDELKRVQNND